MQSTGCWLLVKCEFSLLFPDIEMKKQKEKKKIQHFFFPELLSWVSGAFLSAAPTINMKSEEVTPEIVTSHSQWCPVITHGVPAKVLHSLLLPWPINKPPRAHPVCKQQISKLCWDQTQWSSAAEVHLQRLLQGMFWRRENKFALFHPTVFCSWTGLIIHLLQHQEVG